MGLLPFRTSSGSITGWMRCCPELGQRNRKISKPARISCKCLGRKHCSFGAWLGDSEVRLKYGLGSRRCQSSERPCTSGIYPRQRGKSSSHHRLWLAGGPTYLENHLLRADHLL